MIVLNALFANVRATSCLLGVKKCAQIGLKWPNQAVLQIKFYLSCSLWRMQSDMFKRALSFLYLIFSHLASKKSCLISCSLFFQAVRVCFMVWMEILFWKILTSIGDFLRAEITSRVEFTISMAFSPFPIFQQRNAMLFLTNMYSSVSNFLTWLDFNF